ncbi:MAG: ferritin family protein [Anaerolineaceae bacterium]|jgi:rubrerythrin|nr:ferritin family protein [Anaerolineae bacterium]MDX9832602.1 ferritin family protein [Anaerolineae bacterium]NLF14927.1 ferritin family protein [Anaerolineaceae bacterium]
MTIEEILTEAIQGEVESYELYTNAATMVKAPHIKETLLELAQEELGHKAMLENMLAHPASLRRGVKRLRSEPIQDYKVGDHLVVKPLTPDSTFQDVLIFASRKEQQSHELYRDLAEENEGEIRDLFEAMARDELRHKDLVERWYEEVVYQDF